MPSDLVIFLFVLLGLISGLLSGLLGIGGGVITVPVLYFILFYTGIVEEKMMQVAASTSLAVGFITSGLSTVIQYRKKAIHSFVLKMIIPGLIIGCIAGSILAHYLPSEWLSYVFGIMAILLGVYFLFPKLPSLQICSSPNQSLSLFAVSIGCFSSLLGIGGGSLIFPVLLGYGIPVQNASATSSGSTLVTTLIGSMTYLIIAWHQPGLPETFGYIELPAFIAISMGAVLTTPLGVKFSHTLDIVLIKRIFGSCLALIGLSMFFV